MTDPSDLLSSVRRDRTRAIRELPVTDALPYALRRVLFTDLDAHVRGAAVRRLGALAAAGTEGWLLDALDDRSPMVRDAILRALARCGTPASAPALRELVEHDKMWWIRRGAIYALAAVAGVSEVAAFTRALGDPFWRVRHAAVKVLVVLGVRDPDVRDEVLDAPPSGTLTFLRSSWGPVALEAPARARSASGLPPALLDPDPAVVTARLADDRDVTPLALVELLCDPHMPLRVLASQRLAATGDLEAIDAALDWLEEPRIPHVVDTVHYLLDHLGDPAVELARRALARRDRPGAGQWAIDWIVATSAESLYDVAVERARLGGRALRHAALPLADDIDLVEWAAEATSHDHTGGSLLDAIAAELHGRRAYDALARLDGAALGGRPRVRTLQVDAIARTHRHEPEHPAWASVDAAILDPHHGPRAIAARWLVRAGRADAALLARDPDPAVREAALAPPSARLAAQSRTGAHGRPETLVARTPNAPRDGLDRDSADAHGDLAEPHVGHAGDSVDAHDDADSAAGDPVVAHGDRDSAESYTAAGHARDSVDALGDADSAAAHAARDSVVAHGDGDSAAGDSAGDPVVAHGDRDSTESHTAAGHARDSVAALGDANSAAAHGARDSVHAHGDHDSAESHIADSAAAHAARDSVVAHGDGDSHDHDVAGDSAAAHVAAHMLGALERAVYDADPWVARAAVRALVLAHRDDRLEVSAATIAAGLAALAAVDPMLRAHACRLPLADDRLLAAVVHHTGDRSELVRGAAQEALEHLPESDTRVRALLASDRLPAPIRALAYSWLLRRLDDAAAELARAAYEREPATDVRMVLAAVAGIELPVRTATPRVEAAEPTARPRVIATTERRAFGRAGFTVAPLAVSGAYDPPVRALEGAYAAGVDLYFWEPGYDQLTRFLRAHRDARVLTGTYHADPRSIRLDVERALRTLRRDVLDGFLLFWTRSHARLDAAAHGALIDLKREGKVRAIGFSTHDRAIARAAIESTPWDVVMTRHSAAHPGIETELLPAARATTTAIVTFSAVTYGRMLSGPGAPSAAECYRYCLAQPGVTASITAPRTTRELVANLDALAHPTLPAERIAELRAHGEGVRAESQRFNTLLRQQTRDAAAAARELLATEPAPLESESTMPRRLPTGDGRRSRTRLAKLRRR